MASKIPYVAQPGVITKVLQKAKEAKTPDRFTYDFLENTLGCKGGNYKQVISLAKRLSLLKSDGTPTDLYKKFRNASTSKAAIAQAIKNGYKEFFARNEAANTLDRAKLKGLVLEITGLEDNSRVVQLIIQTFETLKAFADFTVTISDSSAEEVALDIQDGGSGEELRDFNMSLCYTINLVLPKTDDPAVFNAIFRSLRDNLLRK